MFGLRWLDALAVIVAVCFAPSSLGGGAPLTIVISGLDPNKGQVFASLFDRAERFPTEPFAKQAVTVGQSSQIAITFAGLTSGDYAVSVVYDRDLNGALTFGDLGLPQEPFSFSNGVKGPLGPAGFEPALISIDDIPVEHAIILDPAEMQPDQPLSRFPVSAIPPINPDNAQKGANELANDLNKLSPDALLTLKNKADAQAENDAKGAPPE